MLESVPSGEAPLKRVQESWQQTESQSSKKGMDF